MSTWTTLIQDLRAAGMTLSEIGAEIGLSTSAIGDLATGRTASPRGTAALKLHQLHSERCAKDERAA
jgi:transcriptional regulator with XRE-family HTH domain